MSADFRSTNRGTSALLCGPSRASSTGCFSSAVTSSLSRINLVPHAICSKWPDSLFTTRKRNSRRSGSPSAARTPKQSSSLIRPGRSQRSGFLPYRPAGTSVDRTGRAGYSQPKWPRGNGANRLGARLLAPLSPGRSTLSSQRRSAWGTSLRSCGTTKKTVSHIINMIGNITRLTAPNGNGRDAVKSARHISNRNIVAIFYSRATLFLTRPCSGPVRNRCARRVALQFGPSLCRVVNTVRVPIHRAAGPAQTGVSVISWTGKPATRWPSCAGDGNRTCSLGSWTKRSVCTRPATADTGLRKTITATQSSENSDGSELLASVRGRRRAHKSKSRPSMPGKQPLERYARRSARPQRLRSTGFSYTRTGGRRAQ